MDRLHNWINKLGLVRFTEDCAVYLSVPPSNASVEWIFTIMGSTWTGTRNQVYSSRYNLTFDVFPEALRLGMMSKAYTHVISWLSHELQKVGKFESCINPTKGASDMAGFLVELSTFLREAQCPYIPETLNFANSSSFKQKEWILILDFMCGELAAARLYYSRHGETEELEVSMPESDVAKGLRECLQTLGVSKPPPNVTAVQLFSKIDSKVRELMEKHPGISKEPLFTGTLTDKQWEALDRLKEEMDEDYGCRREVLLKRLEVTVQSFKWGETGKKRSEDIERIYKERTALMSKEPSVTIANILAAREDILEEEKTSGSSVRERTKSSINKVVIGAVPDRGGRPEDQQPPPPEVPSWKAGSKQSSYVPSPSGSYSQPPSGSYSQPPSGSYSHAPSGSYGHAGSRSSGSASSFESVMTTIPSSRCSSAETCDFRATDYPNSSSSSGRSSSTLFRSERGRSGLESSGSDISGRHRSRGSHVSDYDNGINGALKHYAPNRPFLPGDTFAQYTESPPQISNPPPPHNIGHMEAPFHTGYSQPAASFRPVYQPVLGFGGYGPMPGVGMGGYGASGGNYEQNAPFIQGYQSGRGQSYSRQPRGGRGPRRGGGRPPRDHY